MAEAGRLVTDRGGGHLLLDHRRDSFWLVADLDGNLAEGGWRKAELWQPIEELAKYLRRQQGPADVLHHHRGVDADQSWCDRALHSVLYRDYVGRPGRGCSWIDGSLMDGAGVTRRADKPGCKWWQAAMATGSG